MHSYFWGKKKSLFCKLCFGTVCGNNHILCNSRFYHCALGERLSKQLYLSPLQRGYDCILLVGQFLTQIAFFIIQGAHIEITSCFQSKLQDSAAPA